MATYLADRVIVYEGTPSSDCIANWFKFIIIMIINYFIVLKI